jgi:hypothetical protein
MGLFSVTHATSDDVAVRWRRTTRADAGGAPAADGAADSRPVTSPVPAGLTRLCRDACGYCIAQPAVSSAYMTPASRGAGRCSRARRRWLRGSAHPVRGAEF